MPRLCQDDGAALRGEPSRKGAQLSSGTPGPKPGHPLTDAAGEATGLTPPQGSNEYALPGAWDASKMGWMEGVHWYRRSKEQQGALARNGQVRGGRLTSLCPRWERLAFRNAPRPWKGDHLVTFHEQSRLRATEAHSAREQGRRESEMQHASGAGDHSAVSTPHSWRISAAACPRPGFPSPHIPLRPLGGKLHAAF